MKTFRLMIISFLVVAITTTTSGVLGEGNDVVYDGEGEPVKPNVPYYISFMTSDYNMWICRKNMGSSDPKACPQQPVMFTKPNIAPTPVMFILASKSETVVRESDKLKIKFVNPRHCGESGFWRVVETNSSTSDGEVVLDGSKWKNDTTFSIHKTNEYYKFTYGDGDFPTTISLSNEYPIYKLLSKRYSGEMEIYFYKILT